MKPYNKLILVWVIGIILWSAFFSIISNSYYYYDNLTLFDWVILLIIPIAVIFYTAGWIKDHRSKK